MIVGEEDAVFLVITKQGFHEILGRFHEFMQIQRAQFFQQFFFLNHIPLTRLIPFVQFAKTISMNRNNMVFVEGGVVAGVYFIMQGEV